jgi:ferric-dicitrate binding protein FerR (iron transport regulator)
MMKKTDGKRRGVAAILAFVLAAAGAAIARADTAAPTTAGVVTSVEGKPTVLRAGAKNAGSLKLDDILNEGDTVKTGPATRVGIAFVGGAELRINENSTFKMLNGGGDKPTSVFTALGNAWTRLLSGNAKIEVRTPAAVCAVRGTEADVNIAGGPMTVKVYEGHVDVMNDKGTTALHAGEITEVAGSGAAPKAARAMTPQDYTTWQNALKPVNLSQSLKRLNSAAVKNRSLDLKMKDRDGKDKNIRLNFEKKQ